MEKPATRPSSEFKGSILERRRRLPLIEYDLSRYSQDYLRKLHGFNGFFFYTKGEQAVDEETPRNLKRAGQPVEVAYCYYWLQAAPADGRLGEADQRLNHSMSILLLDEQLNFLHAKGYYIGHKSPNYAKMTCLNYVFRKLRDLGVKRVFMNLESEFIEAFCAGVFDAVDPFHMKICHEIDENLQWLEEIRPLPVHPKREEYWGFVEKVAQKKIDRSRAVSLQNNQ